jgi:hypothetical protein
MDRKISIAKLTLLLAFAMAVAIGMAPVAHAAGKGKSGGGGGGGFGGGSSGGGGYGYAAQGTVEFGLRGLLDLDTGDDTAVYFDATLGYFILNGVEAGVTVLEGTTPSGERDTVGVFGEYHFVGLLPKITPYAGGALRHTAPPVDVAQGPDGRIMAAYVGLCSPFLDKVAMGITAQDALADHSVLGVIGHRKRQERDVQLTIRLFL